MCFLVDPIQILEMHHNISEDGGCCGKWEFQRWQLWKCSVLAKAHLTLSNLGYWESYKNDNMRRDWMIGAVIW